MSTAPEHLHGESARAPDESVLQRLWRRLGFSVPAWPEMEGGNLMTDVTAILGWTDRLRVLVSGQVMIRISTICQHSPGLVESESTLGVLPPPYRR